MQPFSNHHNDGITSLAADKTYNIKLSGVAPKVGFTDSLNHECTTSDLSMFSYCEYNDRSLPLIKEEGGVSSSDGISSRGKLQENASSINSHSWTKPEGYGESSHWHRPLDTLLQITNEPTTVSSNVENALKKEVESGNYFQSLHTSTDIKDEVSHDFSDSDIIPKSGHITYGLEKYVYDPSNYSQIRPTRSGWKNSKTTHSTVILNGGGSPELHARSDHSYARVVHSNGEIRLPSTAAGSVSAGFICSYCPAFFLHKYKLAIHLRTHTGEKPFYCSYCNVSFAQKGDLRKHIRTHTGEKLFCCNHCNVSFAGKSTLKTHMRMHTGEKPFCCSYCNVSFAHKGNLRRHIRTHTGEKLFCCNHCNVSFAEKSTLKTHMRMHTGEKPFCCSQCNVSFVAKSCLSKHIPTHTGEKPFSCHLCPAAFAHTYPLNRHLRTHFGDNPLN